MTNRRGGFDVGFGTKRAGLNAKQPSDKSGGKNMETKATPKASPKKSAPAKKK